MKGLSFFILLLLTIQTQAQTFTGGNGPILDNQTIDIPLIVSLPQTSIDTTNFGLETVCLNLTHSWLSDLTIELVAPDGTVKPLAIQIGGDSDNMTNTCFNSDATQSIINGTSPFTGNFVPIGQMGAVNNGQNPNGTWYLRITDSYSQDEGAVLDWSLTFGSNPAGYFEFKESDLPIVVIETNGATIDVDTKVMVDMGIIYNGPGIRNHLTDPKNEYNGKIGIEYRGNYSFGLPQKPYSLELQDQFGASVNFPLLGMPAESDWNLMATYNDKSFARNTVPFELFESMGHYGVRSRHVDVVVDGEYKGIYTFTEKIKRDANRIDIAKLNPDEISGTEVTGGYIIKIDYWDNTNSWQSNFSPVGFPGLDIHFVYYYPKPSDIVLQQQTYIQNFMNEFETALYSQTYDDASIGYRKYIDVPSFIDYFIVNELARNVDGFKKSRFLYKDQDESPLVYSKLKEGPVWDFDWALKDIWNGSEDGSGFVYADLAQDVNAPGWYIRLLQDTVFANELRCRYDDLRRTILSENYLHQKVDSVAAVVNESQVWHYQTWGHLGSATGTWEVQAPSQTYAEEVQRLKDWFDRRLAWLDINMPGTLNGCSMSGIEEPYQNELSVYPNPFNSDLNISFSNTLKEEGVINLLDASGRIIQSLELSSNNSNTIQLKNLNDLKSGIYFVELSFGPGKVVKKVVK